MRVVKLSSPASLLLILPLLAVATTGPPAAAEGPTIYNWTGAESTVWNNKKNWQPEGVPQTGDGVSLSPSAARDEITEVPDIILSSLQVSAEPDKPVAMSGTGTVTVAGLLTWNGGDIAVNLVLAQLGAGELAPGAPMHFGGATGQTFRVDGALAMIANPLGVTEPLELMFDANLVVSTSGRVLMGAGTSVRGNRCCAGPTSTVVVEGGIGIDAGTVTTKLMNVGLDLKGTAEVPDEGTLELTGGPVRVDDGATLLGGGTVVVPKTSGDAFDPANPELPDTTFKLLDDLTLADGTTLELGPLAVLSGVGSIKGDGALRLAGPRIHAQVVVADGVPTSTVPGTTTRLVKWNPGVAGQHGFVVPQGGLDVAAGSTLSVHGGTRLVVPDDATMRLPGGATLTADGCCTEPGRVTVQSGGTLAIGSPTGDAPAVLDWVELGGNGAITHTGKSEWDLAGTAFTTGATFTGSGRITGDLPAGALKVTPLGVFVVDGDYTANAGGTLVAGIPTALNATATSRLFVTGTAHLAGRLGTVGTTRFPAGRALLALSAGQVTGSFSCTRTPGFLPRQGATTLHLVSIYVRDFGCLVSAPRRVLAATWTGLRTPRVTVPAAAERVMLKVTMSRATQGAARLMLSGGPSPRASLAVAPGETETFYVPIGLDATRKLTARLDSRARVVITQIGWY
jgi:hypothetical protein